MDTPTTPTVPPAPLPGIEIETGPSPERAVIWLHGLGADGNDFVPVVQALDMDRLPPTRFILPHAPSRPVTVNGGYVMPAWFDIQSLDFADRREDAQGIAASAAQVEAFIARENARGIEDRHIVLAGFSQGGAIVLHAGLRHPRRLAGVLALSTYVPLAATLAAEANAANRDLPVFMAHGEEDPVIPHAFGKKSGDLLAAIGYPLRWRSYPIEHAVCMEEIRDLEDWLAEVLAAPAG